MIHQSSLELVGGTPLLQLKNWMRLHGLKANVIAKIEVEAGHGGTTGRYKQWKEVSFENAWCLRTMGVA